ncbi:MAG TPA: acyl-CoA thioesterase [Candidatus Gallacutalibacter pullicola]|uniref:Acyl-CoA thioesterase n=1 Tax=Candidatus Gallacutalibacter pullicola TaxID=2840830 RepID=A0A9D1J0I5_9FIRM|nr:acyl-CoA thioesterase [Candidatus Gallacutalibacter pullicola]
MSELKAKRVSESLTEMTQIVLNGHINGYGRLFGGQLVEWIDVVAAVVARRHAQCEVTTAEIDNLQFKYPVHTNSTLVLKGRLTYVGRTSMEVRVDSYVERLTGDTKLVNRAYLVMVALDSAHKPIEVPRLILETDEDRAEWEAGERRRLLRRQRKEEQF